MHYRHAFHAGNFADVFKHVLLCGLIAAFKRKPAPWTFYDTHAGAGGYALLGSGERTGEYRQGVARLYALGEVPPPLSDWLRLVRAFNEGGELLRYPGSPWIARQLAGDDDRLVLCESVAPVHEQLRLMFADDARVAVHRRDGYELAALLPPATKRGLVLIDPPFESPQEFDAVAETVAACRRRFVHGVYAVWYPLKKRFDADRFRRRLVRESGGELLDVRFETGARGEGQMRSCGMAILNAPFQFEAQVAPALHDLKRHLAQGPRAAWTAQTLTRSPEDS